MAVCEGAVDEDDLADVLHMAVLELDFVSASLVGHTVDRALNNISAKVPALQSDVGPCKSIKKRTEAMMDF
jgi:hypothetical protein